MPLHNPAGRVAPWGSRFARPPTSTTWRPCSAPSAPDANVCWCLSYRLTPRERTESWWDQHAASSVRRLVRQRRRRPACSHTTARRSSAGPRCTLEPTRSFARNRKIPFVDDIDVWSVWCIRVRPGHRGRGHFAPPALRRCRVRWQLTTRRRSRATRSTIRERRSTSRWPMSAPVNGCVCLAASRLAGSVAETDSRDCSTGPHGPSGLCMRFDLFVTHVTMPADDGHPNGLRAGPRSRCRIRRRPHPDGTVRT